MFDDQSNYDEYACPLCKQYGNALLPSLVEVTKN